MREQDHLDARDVTQDDTPSFDVTSLDLGGDVVFVTDAQGTIVDVNDAFVRVTGFSRREAIGSTPRILSSGYQSQEFYAELWDTISQGRVWQGQLVDRRRDGDLRTHHVTISPVRDEAGHVTHYVAVERDLTGELGRQAAVGSAGLLHTDLTGRCVYADGRAAALLDCQPSGLLGEGMLGCLQSEDADALREVIGMATTQGREHRVDVRTRAGDAFSVDVAPLTVSSGTVIGAILGFEDMSERLSVHRELDRRDAFLVSVLDALPEPVAVVAADGTVMAVNRSWRETETWQATSALRDARVGHDLTAMLARAAEEGDDDAAVLRNELVEVLTGVPGTGSHPRVTPIVWDEGGAIVRLPD